MMSVDAAREDAPASSCPLCRSRPPLVRCFDCFKSQRETKRRQVAPGFPPPSGGMRSSGYSLSERQIAHRRVLLDNLVRRHTGSA